MNPIGDHAVVLGGSMAGVLAARVLADRYRRVTVVERDTLPAVGMRRRGVPQDRHIHALQTRGKRAIETLFPGATEELVEQGAVIGDWGSTATMCFSGHRLRSVEAGLDLLALSRPLLEGHLRARLGHLGNVTLSAGCEVHGLAVERDRVTGARILQRRDSGAEVVLPADLVLDATGRGSRSPRWLHELGYPVPREDETGLEVTYTSCRFPREATDERHAIIVSAVHPGRRGGGAIAVEGDSWVVTLGGVLGERAPTDVGGFVDYAATLAIPDIHELVRGREPLSEPVLMRYPTARRRRYELLDRFPGGVVVLGDALCSFNPVYGQGMSVAAVEALALGECLDAGDDAVGQRFFAAVTDLVGDAWGMAADGDAQYTRASPPSLPDRLAARFQRRMLETAAVDPVVARSFLEVMAMTARPTSLLRPRLVARVLAGGRRAADVAGHVDRHPAITGTD